LRLFVALLVCFACLPASYTAFRHVHVWWVITDENIGKRLDTEDPAYVPSVSRRLAVYARAIPGFLLFALPGVLGSVAPLFASIVFAFRLCQPSRQFRSAGWILFSVAVLCSGVLMFLGTISHARGGWAFLILAAILILIAFSAVIPVHSDATNVG
jgi:hypothetical protein